MIQVEVTTTPALLLDPQEAKDFLNLDLNDAELMLLMRGIQEKAEAYCGRSFTTRTITYKLDMIGGDDVLTLPRGPVTSITSIETLDESDVATTIASSTYYMADNDRLVFTTAPDVQRDYGGILITYVAGLSTKTPDAVKVGMLKGLATLFEHREDFIVGSSVAMLPDVSKTYLDQYRVLC